MGEPKVMGGSSSYTVKFDCEHLVKGSRVDVQGGKHDGQVVELVDEMVDQNMWKVNLVDTNEEITISKDNLSFVIEDFPKENLPTGDFDGNQMYLTWLIPGIACAAVLVVIMCLIWRCTEWRPCYCCK